MENEIQKFHSPVVYTQTFLLQGVFSSISVHARYTFPCAQFSLTWKCYFYQSFLFLYQNPRLSSDLPPTALQNRTAKSTQKNDFRKTVSVFFYQREDQLFMWGEEDLNLLHLITSSIFRVSYLTYIQQHFSYSDEYNRQTIDRGRLKFVMQND